MRPPIKSKPLYLKVFKTRREHTRLGIQLHQMYTLEDEYRKQVYNKMYFLRRRAVGLENGDQSGPPKPKRPRYRKKRTKPLSKPHRKTSPKTPPHWKPLERRLHACEAHLRTIAAALPGATLLERKRYAAKQMRCQQLRIVLYNLQTTPLERKLHSYETRCKKMRTALFNLGRLRRPTKEQERKIEYFEAVLLGMSPAYGCRFDSIPLA